MVNQSKSDNFVSGLVGGLVSVTLCAPLDIARTRFQVQRLSTTNKEKYSGITQCLMTIFKEEGFRGFYKGYNATMVSIPLFHSLYFTCYESSKQYLDHHHPKWNKAVVHCTAAGISGFICDLITNPLWVARLRLQSQFLHHPDQQKYSGLWQTMRLIFQEEGIVGLYRGLGTSIFGVSHVMIYFPIYEYLKANVFLDKNTGKTDSYHILMASITSKLIASTATYPHIVVRSRLQENPGALDRKVYKGIGIKRIVKDTWRAEGLKGFYRGLTVDMARVLPANSITFVVFEFTKQYLQKKQKSKLAF